MEIILMSILPSVLIIPAYIYMYYAYKKTVEYKNGEIMLVKIPYEHKDNKDIMEITEIAKKSTKIFLVLSIIFIILGNIMIIFIEELFSPIFTMIFYLIALIGPYGYLCVKLQRERSKILKIKHDNNWLEYNEVYIDTKLLNSGLKDKYKKLSKFNIIFLFIFLIISNIIYNKGDFFMNIIMILSIFLENIAFIGIAKMEDYIYLSEDYKENYEYNKKKIEEVYKVIRNFIIINYINLILYIFITVTDIYLRVGMYIFISILVLDIIYILIALFKIFRKYKIESNYRSLSDAGDFYDYFGYSNPYDSRIMVSDRITVGTTFNRGNAKGKIVISLIYISSILLLLGTIFFTSFTNSGYDYNLTNNFLKIDSYGYSSEIRLKDIEKLEISDKIDFSDAIRTNGVGTNKYSYGFFRLKDYGRVKLYSNNDNDLYIIIKDKENYYIFNDVDKEKTERLYEELIKFVGKKEG